MASQFSLDIQSGSTTANGAPFLKNKNVLSNNGHNEKHRINAVRLCWYKAAAAAKQMQSPAVHW